MGLSSRLPISCISLCPFSPAKVCCANFLSSSRTRLKSRKRRRREKREREKNLGRKKERRNSLGLVGSRQGEIYCGDWRIRSTVSLIFSVEAGSLRRIKWQLDLAQPHADQSPKNRMQSEFFFSFSSVSLGLCSKRMLAESSKVEFSQLYRHRSSSSSSSSSSRRGLEESLSLQLSALASFDIQSPTTLRALLLHATGVYRSPPGGPSFSPGGPLQAADDLRLRVWVLLREQQHQQQHRAAANELVSPFCRVCNLLYIFLNQAPHAACLFLLPPAHRRGVNAHRSASKEDRGGGPLGAPPEGHEAPVATADDGHLPDVDICVLELLFNEAERILSRLGLTTQGDDGAQQPQQQPQQQQQQQPQQQQQQQRQQEQQRVGSDRDPQQGDMGPLEGATSSAGIKDAQGGRLHETIPDSFQKPRPLKRRAAGGPGGGGGPPSQNPQGSAPPLSSQVGSPPAKSSACHQPLFVGEKAPDGPEQHGMRRCMHNRSRQQQQQHTAEEVSALLCCCLYTVRGSIPAAAAAELEAAAAAECLLLHHLLLLLLRLTRCLQTTMTCLATRAATQCLGLHALHSPLLLPPWRPQQQQQQQQQDEQEEAWTIAIKPHSSRSSNISSSSSSEIAAADAAALAGCFFDMCGALAERVDSFQAFKDLLRAPLPSTQDTLLGGPFEWAPPPALCCQRGGGGPPGRGAPRQSEERGQVSLRHAPLSEIRLQLLELVALLRQLSVHLPCGRGAPQEQQAKEEKRGPQEARGEGTPWGLPPLPPRMHGLLKAAAWLMSSEAPTCIKGAPLWLWGPLAPEVYVQDTSAAAAAAEDREQAAADAVGALQAAAVRALAAGGGGAPSAEADAFYTQIDPSPDGVWFASRVHAKDFSCLQNLVRLAWEALLLPPFPEVEEVPLALVEGGITLGLDCVYGGGVAAGCMRSNLSPEEEESEQQHFSRELELMQLGGGPPLGSSLGAPRGSSCLYTSGPLGSEAPMQMQTPERKQQLHACEQQLVANVRRRALLQQQHIAEDCLEILSRGGRGPPGAPFEAQWAHREKGPPLPAAPCLSNRALGPSLPLLLTLLERMQSAGFAEEGESPKNTDFSVLTSFFVEAKLHAVNANNTI
ncbi:hypothetical protein ACSSS7_007865 [Eimeria intestinalis]